MYVYKYRNILYYLRYCWKFEIYKVICEQIFVSQNQQNLICQEPVTARPRANPDIVRAFDPLMESAESVHFTVKPTSNSNIVKNNIGKIMVIKKDIKHC